VNRKQIRIVDFARLEELAGEPARNLESEAC